MDTPLEKPATDNRKDWKAYWQQQGQPWRYEPEIPAERQAYLEERRAIPSDFEQGIYPFGGVRLSRADIEWLLATHDHGRGPIDPNDEAQRERIGLDLRGVDCGMQEEHLVNLNDLPLAYTRFGASTSIEERIRSSPARVAKAQANLQNANLGGADLQSASLGLANLQSADLSFTNLQGAFLGGANLQSADFSFADLRGANLSGANLQSAKFRQTFLLGANLSYALMDVHTRLDDVYVDTALSVSDVTWGGANLINLDWSPVTSLADETTARRRRDGNGRLKGQVTRLDEYRAAVRAYRLLTTALRNQGMLEEADRFAYRAQVCQRAVFRLQRKRGQALWSGVLDLIAGYGYRPVRSFIAYICIILAFAAVYFLFGQTSHALSPPESIVVSMTAFHGRGFFANQFQPGDPQAYAAALEAFLGLMIEVSFIATFTQRFFGK